MEEQAYRILSTLKDVPFEIGVMPCLSGETFSSVFGKEIWAEKECCNDIHAFTLNVGYDPEAEYKGIRLKDVFGIGVTDRYHLVSVYPLRINVSFAQQYDGKVFDLIFKMACMVDEKDIGIRFVYIPGSTRLYSRDIRTDEISDVHEVDDITVSDLLTMSEGEWLTYTWKEIYRLGNRDDMYGFMWRFCRDMHDIGSTYGTLWSVMYLEACGKMVMEDSVVGYDYHDDGEFERYDEKRRAEIEMRKRRMCQRCLGVMI